MDGGELMMNERERRGGVRLVASLALAGSVGGLAAGQATFTNLGVFEASATGPHPRITAMGVSGDGTTVTGSALVYTPPQRASFSWTAQQGLRQLIPLPAQSDSAGFAISADGLRIVGYSGLQDLGTSRPARWTGTPDAESLGLIPFARNVHAMATSADGSVTVGNAIVTAIGSRAFRHKDGVIAQLGGIPDLLTSTAAGVSGDGTIIVGAVSRTSAVQNHAYYWTDASSYVSLPLLPGGSAAAAAAISTDGLVITGYSQSANGDRAFRWTLAGGIEDLGVPDGASGSYGVAINQDGSVISGYAMVDGVERAALWRAGAGFVDLNNYLPALGIDLTGWTLLRANGLSSDGRTIVGDGLLDGERRAWIATGIGGGACLADIDDSGEVDLGDFFEFLNCFDTSQACADLDGNPGVDLGDFFAFLNGFDSGC